MSGGYLWEGRFGEPPAEAMMAFSQSIGFDQALAGDDIDGSRAHVRMLRAVGLVSDDDEAALLGALDQVEAELAAGALALDAEDIHTAVEQRVTELAGAAGGRLHTGRSRNDQVALDLRLYLRREGRAVAREVHELQAVLVERAAAELDAGTYLPGYTHLQRAQPVLLAHHLLAHMWALGRDIDRWCDTLDRADVSPLGAGALAGSSLPLDPDRVAADLGFRARFENSLDAVADRDFVAEALFVAALTQVHLSRLGEEIVWWSSDEVGFVTLADAWSTGSSMLPQKKNPDVAELARGAAGRLIGELAGFLATLKGLPLAYNRDLQGDKEPLFVALGTCGRALVALRGVMATVGFDRERMAAAADGPAAAATDLAELLVAGGAPFREAHAAVGGLVREAGTTGRALRDLVAADPRFGSEATTLLDPGVSVQRRTTPGGAGPGPVAEQLAAARARLADQSARLGDRGD